jgi:tetratricopeptide (TPR) repeat protein
MNSSPLFSWSAALVGLATVAAAQSVTVPAASPRASVSQVVGITQVTVNYGRPAVNKREIWGQLVPYGFNDLGFGTSKAAPWRAGADENTVITFAHDVRVAGQPLAAGAYGLFMALSAAGDVTLIFSRDSGAWGSFFYDPARDALRVSTRWEEAPFREQLAYEFSEVTKTAAVLALHWEKKRIPIPLAVDTDTLVIANLKRELTTAKGFQYQAWVNASAYLVQINRELELALQWAEAAVNTPFVGRRNFLTLSNQAAVLEKLGRTAEGAKRMDEAVKYGSASEIHQYGRRLLTEKRKERALETFQLNARLHPDEWPVNYGLARGYSALGQYPAALAALLQAQTQVPAGDTVNAAAIKANLEKLRRGEDIN